MVFLFLPGKRTGLAGTFLRPCKYFCLGFVHSRSPIRNDFYAVWLNNGTGCPVHISDPRQSELRGETRRLLSSASSQVSCVTAIDRRDPCFRFRVPIPPQANPPPSTGLRLISMLSWMISRLLARRACLRLRATANWRTDTRG